MKRLCHVTLAIIVLYAFSANVMAGNGKGLFVQSKAKNGLIQQAAPTSGGVSTVASFTAKSAPVNMAMPTGGVMLQAKPITGLFMGTVANNSQSQQAGNTSVTTSGQESFQKQPLVIGKVLPLQARDCQDDPRDKNFRQFPTVPSCGHQASTFHSIAPAKTGRRSEGDHFPKRKEYSGWEPVYP